MTPDAPETAAERPRVGIVLAGGYSTRFGDVDKVTVDLAGTPMVARTVSRVDAAVDGVLVSCRPDQVHALRGILSDLDVSACLVPDPVPDRGPVAGLAAALRATPAPAVAVVAADNPLVDPAFLEYLFDRTGDADGAVPELDGRRNPAQAVFRAEPLATACRDAIDAGDASLLAVLDALDVALVPESEVLRHTDRERFLDVNTPADVERALDRLER